MEEKRMDKYITELSLAILIITLNANIVDNLIERQTFRLALRKNIFN